MRGVNGLRTKVMRAGSIVGSNPFLSINPFFRFSTTTKEGMRCDEM